MCIMYRYMRLCFFPSISHEYFDRLAYFGSTLGEF
ncbi:unnamed protein product [Schistosoma mattheei]|uniref:Uncharacterized protein n=1 Tax=Schistosoma mattheei TaxID=31246 RepID=A0A183P6Y9_9TREM|nr:unnamed protein product [Schistosoma mattheei]